MQTTPIDETTLEESARQSAELGAESQAEPARKKSRRAPESVITLAPDEALLLARKRFDRAEELSTKLLAGEPIDLNEQFDAMTQAQLLLAIANPSSGYELIVRQA